MSACDAEYNRDPDDEGDYCLCRLGYSHSGPHECVDGCDAAAPSEETPNG